MKLVNIEILEYYDGIQIFTAHKLEGTFSSEQIYFFIAINDKGDYIGIGDTPAKFEQMRKRKHDMRKEFENPKVQKYIGRFSPDGFTAYAYKGEMTEEMLPDHNFFLPKSMKQN